MTSEDSQHETSIVMFSKWAFVHIGNFTINVHSKIENTL